MIIVYTYTQAMWKCSLIIDSSSYRLHHLFGGGHCILGLLGNGGAGLSARDGFGGILGIAGLGGRTGGEGPLFPPVIVLVLVLSRGTGRVCPCDE